MSRMRGRVSANQSPVFQSHDHSQPIRGRVSSLAPPSISHQNWFPLATEQLRLRALSEGILFSPSPSSSFYLTFHESAFAPPFYTSSPAETLDQRAVWPDLEHKMEEFGGVRAVILRLWSKVGGECLMLMMIMMMMMMILIMLIMIMIMIMMM